MFWNRVKQITAREIQSSIDSEETIIIDIRRPKDYEISHIEGAVLADKKTVHEQIDGTRKSTRIICYCYMGVSSKTACKNLIKAGFSHVLNLKGGYKSWVKAFPTMEI